MVIICAWCLRLLGITKVGLGVSHGMCADCYGDVVGVCYEPGVDVVPMQCAQAPSYDHLWMDVGGEG